MLNPITNLQGRQLRSVGSVLHEALYTIFQLLLLLLLLLGIGGVTFTAISSDGWLMSTLRRVWNRDPIYALLGICGVLLGGGWLKGFFEQRLENVDHVGDVLICAWLILGVYFGARLVLTGSL